MTARVREYLRSTTGRLAGTYLIIIMALTLIFSVVIFTMATSEFDRPIPPPRDGQQQLEENREEFEALLKQRADEARIRILIGLAFLNISVLLFGAWFSHYLARKTLEPIEQAMEAQSQFISDASHELRTPLTALQTTNEVALRKKKLSLDDAKEVIAHNIEETVKLRDLSNNPLGIVSQERADTTKESFNIQDVISNVLTTLAPLAIEKNISVEDAVSPQKVFANRAAVTQVTKILLENAIKYSPESSRVTISSKTTGNYLHMTISDEGVGIAPEDHEKIFTRFYRVDQARTKSKPDGNGLGLAIALTISERQGIGLSVSSELGEGAEFTLAIPLGSEK